MHLLEESVFLCSFKALKIHGVGRREINLAGRCTVAEQKLVVVKTHQNTWKAKSCGGTAEPCRTAGAGRGAGRGVKASVGAL